MRPNGTVVACAVRCIGTGFEREADSVFQSCVIKCKNWAIVSLALRTDDV